MNQFNKNQAKIIIVDDSQTARQTLAEILNDFNARLFFAENGEKLLALLAHETFDLFILDVNMPDIDGIALTKKIRNKTDCHDAPILILTGLLQNELIIDAFKAGANDFVQKPPNYFEIRTRVTNLLQRYQEEAKLNSLLAEVQVRNQRLTDRNREIQSTIDILTEKYDLTQNKLNEQLIYSSESSVKNSDLLLLKQQLSEQVKELSSQNLELLIMLNEKYNRDT